MNERTKKLLITIIVSVVFVVSIALVIIGQRNIGPKGLGMMLVGLSGLVILLGIYNHQYK